MLKVSLDTNLFYDLAEKRQGASSLEALLDLAHEGRLQLFSTATTDFEDHSGAATSSALKLMCEGIIQEAKNAGTPGDFMPGGPGLYIVEDDECGCLLGTIWPNEQWRGASDNKRNDVLHLLAHKKNGHDHFATNDKELLRKQIALEKDHGISVKSLEELLHMMK